MAVRFKAGDTVQLIVGGPVMVVDDVTSADGCWCVWFAGKKRERSFFHFTSLKAAKPEHDE